MATPFLIDETKDGELNDILALYPVAFPDEDLRPVVSGLISGDADVLSLGALNEGTLIGHVLFTIFEVDGEDQQRAGALLAPLGVIPDHQGSGVGSALVMEGFKRLEANGVSQIFVLGDPGYYSRFGFEQESDVLPPYPLPNEWAAAWQSILLGDREPLRPGAIKLPGVWMDEKLWLP